MQSQQRSTFHALDWMRFIAALLVVAIHTDPLLMYSEDWNFNVKQIIARIAVPFFFIASGYLFARKNATLNQPYPWSSLGQYVLRITFIYLLWLAVFIRGDIEQLYANNGFDYGIAIHLYIKNVFLEGGHWHLWFFPALIFGVTLFTVLRRFLPLLSIVIVALALYAVGLFGDSYYSYLANSPTWFPLYESYAETFGMWTRNGLFFGFAFVALGALLAERNVSLRSHWSGLLTLVSFALLWVEATWLRDHAAPPWYAYNMMIFLVPTAIFLLLWLMSVNFSFGGTSVAKWLRHSSLLIYGIHAYFIIQFESIRQQSLTFFLYVTGCSIAFAAIYLALCHVPYVGKLLKKFL